MNALLLKMYQEVLLYGSFSSVAAHVLPSQSWCPIPCIRTAVTFSVPSCSFQVHNFCQKKFKEGQWTQQCVAQAYSSASCAFSAPWYLNPPFLCGGLQTNILQFDSYFFAGRVATLSSPNTK